MPPILAAHPANVRCKDSITWRKYQYLKSTRVITMNQKEVNVWDAGVRLFHWSLVISFVTAYLTGEEDSNLHVYAGYAIVGLLVFRILWGFIGTRHARFSDFVYSPRLVLDYCRGLLDGNVEHYQGHNPAGGLMMIIMLLVLIATSYTGLKTYGAEGHGPLAAESESTDGLFISSAYADRDDDRDDEEEEHEKGHEREGHDDDERDSDSSSEHHDEDHEAEEYWEELHEFFANLLVLLIIIHVCGVAISSRLHGENLVKAMITGRKS
jgi:cytochrome b